MVRQAIGANGNYYKVRRTVGLNNTTWAAPEERVLRSSNERLRKKLILTSAQKPVLCKIKMEFNYRRVRELIFFTVASSSKTAKACLPGTKALSFCMLWKELCTSSGCAAAAVKIGAKHNFEIHFTFGRKRRSGWGKQSIGVVNGNRTVRKKDGWLDGSGRALSLAYIPVVCNTFSWEFVQS